MKKIIALTLIILLWAAPLFAANNSIYNRRGGGGGSLSDPLILTPSPTTLTIVAGGVAPTTTGHLIDTVGNSAATSDLTNIAAGTDGQILYIRAVAAARIPVLKNSDNIHIPMGTQISMGSTTNATAYKTWYQLKYDSALSKWAVMGTMPDSWEFSTLDMSDATGYSIPFPTGTAAAPTENGRMYQNSTTKVLTVGDGTAARRIPMDKAAVALTSTGGAIPLTVGSRLYTYAATDNEDTTITFSGAGNAGDEITIIFKTGTSSADEIITFHATLVSSTGTLTLADADDKFYVVRFVSDGAHWYEVSRTAVQT